MKMRVFTVDWVSVSIHEIEKEVNDFLETLPKGAVKFVQTAACSTRTHETDQMETELVVTVWYET